MLSDNDVILGSNISSSSNIAPDHTVSDITTSLSLAPVRSTKKANNRLPNSFFPVSAREEGVKIYRYVGCKLDKEISKADFVTPDESRYNITLVTVGSRNRLFVMPIFVRRWNGPVVFTIYLKEEEVATFDRFLLQPNSSVLCYPHIQIFTYVASEGSFFHENYPINILRNIGIHHVSTSHFVLVDIDMWFSYSSYEVLMELPSVITEDPFAVVVIPAFFHTGWRIANGTLEQQVESVIHRIPYTMNDLQRCIKIRKCNYVKKHLFTHYYVSPSWAHQQRQKNPPRAYVYNCWKNIYQEPYLLVKRNDSVTYFNERFINYGFNKISYVETLRLEGYHFYLAGRMFAFDLPHAPSKYQKSHVSKLGQGNYITNSIYMQRLKVRTRGRQNVLPICKGHHSMLTVQDRKSVV